MLISSSRIISIALILIGSTYYTYAKSYLEPAAPAIRVVETRDQEKKV